MGRWCVTLTGAGSPPRLMRYVTGASVAARGHGLDPAAALGSRGWSRRRPAQSAPTASTSSPPPSIIELGSLLAVLAYAFLAKDRAGWMGTGDASPAVVPWRPRPGQAIRHARVFALDWSWRGRGLMMARRPGWWPCDWRSRGSEHRASLPGARTDVGHGR